MSLLLAVLAAAAYAAGSVLQAAAARRPGTIMALAVSPLYLAGLAADGLAWALSLLALRGLPVFVVQAILAGSLGLTVLLASLVLHARMRRLDLAAVGVLVAALAVIGFSGHEQPAAAISHPAEIALTVAGATIAGAAGLAVAFAARTDRRGLLLAILAGLAYSATALAGRAVQLRDPWIATLAEPLTWVVVSAGVAGTVAYAAALQRGTVGPVTALLWAVEVVVPAAAAIPLLGDDVRPGWTPAAVLALAAVVGTAAVLAWSPATTESA